MRVSLDLYCPVSVDTQVLVSYWKAGVKQLPGTARKGSSITVVFLLLSQAGLVGVKNQGYGTNGPGRSKKLFLV